MRVLQKIIGLVILVSLMSCFTSPAQAAPAIPEIYDVEGVIVSIAWHPRKLIRKAEPGISGTLGIDFYAPARYVVSLTQAEVENKSPWADKAKAKSPDYQCGFSVVIYHKEGDGFLKPGMRIKLTRYQVLGDEGGTWYDLDKLEILAPKSE